MSRWREQLIFRDRARRGIISSPRTGVRKMTEGFRRHPCLVCARCSTGALLVGGSDERERGARRRSERKSREETTMGGDERMRETEREAGEGKSEEERGDIDRTSSRATRSLRLCQASWKERTTIRLLFLSLPFPSSLSFFYALFLKHMAMGCRASPSAFLSFSLSFSLPPVSRADTKEKKGKSH